MGYDVARKKGSVPFFILNSCIGYGRIGEREGKDMGEEDTIFDRFYNPPDKEEEYGFKVLIEALEIFRKYGDSYSPIHCEHDVMQVCIDPAIVSKEDIKKLEGMGFHPDESQPIFYSFRFGSA